jgi:hypothetical protein
VPAVAGTGGSVAALVVGLSTAIEVGVPGGAGTVFAAVAGFVPCTEVRGPAVGATVVLSVGIGPTVVVGVPGTAGTVVAVDVFAPATGFAIPGVPVAVLIVGWFAVTAVEAAGLVERVIVAAGCFGGATMLIALRTMALTPLTTFANADRNTTAAFVPGTGFCAVVVHVPGDTGSPLQLVNESAFTWQHPQSWVFLPWSGPDAPLVPWLL